MDSTPSYLADIPISQSSQVSKGLESDAFKHKEKEIITSDNFLKTLSTIVVSYKQDWKKVTKKISKIFSHEFSASELKEIYWNYKPKTKRIVFNKNIDNCIKYNITKLGLDWERISDLIPGLTSISIRNRYYSKLRHQNHFSRSISLKRTRCFHKAVII
jgi:hypothetical protein